MDEEAQERLDKLEVLAYSIIDLNGLLGGSERLIADLARQAKEILGKDGPDLV